MLNISRIGPCIRRVRRALELTVAGGDWQEAVRLQVPDAEKITKHGFAYQTISFGSREEVLRKQRFRIVHADGSVSYPTVTTDWLLDGWHNTLPAAVGALQLDDYLKKQASDSRAREDKITELELALQTELPEADFNGVFDIVRSTRRIKRLGKIRAQLMHTARALASSVRSAAENVTGGFKLYEVHLTGKGFGVRLPLLMPALL